MSNNSFSIVGLVHQVFEEQIVSGKFRKREFVLEIPGQYPEHVKFQLVQDKCPAIDGFPVGTRVQVDFNLRGRAFTGKDQGQAYFTNIEAWRLKPAAEEAAPAAPKEAAREPQAVGPQV